MWYLLEDFLEQPLIMKAFIAWGWLAVWIMVFSAVLTGQVIYTEYQEAQAAKMEMNAPAGHH